MLRIVSTGSAAAAAILVSSFLATAASAAGTPLGVWMDDKGRGAVEIAKCGGKLCGTVVWVKAAADKKGCGAKILGDVKPAGGGTWDYGWIYSPDHGRRFDVALTPVGADRLRVTGYAGIKLFGESRMWTRAPADLERCDKTEAATAAPRQPAPTRTARAAPDVEPTAPAAPASAPATQDAPASKPAADADSPVLTSPPTPATPPAATAPQSEMNTAAAPAETTPTDETATDATASDSAASGPGGLSFDKVLKKTADGRCKLDLPWVKIDFNCKDM